MFLNYPFGTTHESWVFGYLSCFKKKSTQLACRLQYKFLCAKKKLNHSPKRISKLKTTGKSKSNRQNCKIKFLVPLQDVKESSLLICLWQDDYKNNTSFQGHYLSSGQHVS